MTEVNTTGERETFKLNWTLRKIRERNLISPSRLCVGGVEQGKDQRGATAREQNGTKERRRTDRLY